MIKKLKIGIFLVVLSLVAISGAKDAGAQALSWTADSNVTINSSDYIIRSGSAATQVDVNATTLVVLVPAASTFTLASASGFTLTNTDDAATPVVTAQTCASGVSTVAYTGTGASVTFTPTTVVACSGGGGGGGGGGGSSTPATPAVTPATPGEIPGCGIRTTGFSSSTGFSCVGNTATTPATPATPATTVIPGCGNRTTGFSSSSGASCVGNSVGASATVGAGAEMSASAPGRVYALGATTLKNGSKGEAVKELQRFLNVKLNLGLVVDGKLGPKTIAVIKKWQKDNGLVADGLIGAKTKAKMNTSVQ